MLYVGQIALHPHEHGHPMQAGLVPQSHGHPHTGPPVCGNVIGFPLTQLLNCPCSIVIAPPIGT
jgi:hypothetical protein